MKNKHKRISYKLVILMTVFRAVIITMLCALLYRSGGELTGSKAGIVFPVLIALCLLECVFMFRKTGKNVIKPLEAVRDTVYGYTSKRDAKASRDELNNIGTDNELGGLIDDIDHMISELDSSMRDIETAKKNDNELMIDVMKALATAIDDKDKYTCGHSGRVADYSRKIAELSGKSEEECQRIYYAALLHDVGKIGVAESIINKKGKLTDEEYEVIKQHPVMGAKILESIKNAPYITAVARSHHERYDGKGYPDNLTGTDIPDEARIVSVADAYDAMTSRRSYRAPIPQQKVREELVKGLGTQFDPTYATIMLRLIDMDKEFEMKDDSDRNYLASDDELVIDSHRSDVSPGIPISQCMLKINIKVKPYNRSSGIPARPSLILYDALDGQIHTDIKDIRDLEYFEYGEIWFDGNTNVVGARKMQTTTVYEGSGKPDEYMIEAVKCRDHALIRIVGENLTFEVITAFPNNTRFAHIAFTGEHCCITSVVTEQSEEETPPDAIPRIAEAVNYIGVPEGDIPNVQIDGFRAAASQGILIEDNMQITFHAMTFPTARLVWHCPYLNIFGSKDGNVNGVNYRDYMLLRIDGECWEGDPSCKVTSSESKNEDFSSWDAWKARCKAGFDCTFTFEKKANTITVRTENGGISVTGTAEISDGTDKIYAAITGDQVAITNIRIKHPGSDT